MIEPAMHDLLVLLSDPAAWLALATLVVMEVVLGIDNLIFISILTNKLPEHQRSRARRIGIGLAADPAAGAAGQHRLHRPARPSRCSPLFGHGFSWRDLILMAGGLFLIWKATTEIHDIAGHAEHERRRARPPASPA